MNTLGIAPALIPHGGLARRVKCKPASAPGEAHTDLASKAIKRLDEKVGRRLKGRRAGSSISSSGTGTKLAGAD